MIFAGRALDTGFGKFELHPFRHIARSLLEMALITGCLVRVLATAFNAHGDHLDWHIIVGRFIFIPLIVLGMAAVHLAQFPVRQWLWRAPLFAVVEVAAAALTSLALIAAGRERIGVGIATWADWPSMTGQMFVWHLTIICVFALVLGVIVQWVRKREFIQEHHHEHLLTHPPTALKSREGDDPASRA